MLFKSIHFEKPQNKSQSEAEIAYEDFSECGFEYLQKPLFFLKVIKHFIIETFQRSSDFLEFILLNIYAFFFLVLYIQILYLKDFFFCNPDKSNFLAAFVFVSRKIIFILAYYGYLVFYAFETFWSNAIDTISIIIIISNSAFILLLKYYNIDPNENLVDIYASNSFIMLFKILLNYKTEFFSWKNIRSRSFPMLFLVGFCLIFHHYIMIKFLIPQFKRMITFETDLLTDIFFQIFYFTYFQIYRKIFFEILIMYSQVLEESSFLGKICIIMLSKYYLIDAVCSTLPAPTTEPLNSIGFWLGICNFLYQILVFYYNKFDVFRAGKKVVDKLMKKNHPKLDKRIKYLQGILRISLNDVLIIIFTNLLLKFWLEMNLDDPLKNCKFILLDNAKLKGKNLILLFLSNLIMLSIILKRKKQFLKVFMEREYHSIMFQIYSLILLHFLIDVQMQYYFEFYNL